MTTRLQRLDTFSEIIQGGRQGFSGNDFVARGYPAYGAGGLNGFLPSFEFDRDAVILSSIGARCGKCFYASGKWNSLANTQVILPDTGLADSRFLWFQLNDEGRWHRSGTAQPFIKPSDVKSAKVYLPPLSEQRRIAAILDQANALRAKRRAVLARLDEMAQAIFVEMFGRLDERSSKDRIRLDEFADVLVGFPFQSASYTDDPTGIRLCRGANVLPRRINWDDLVRWESSDMSRFEKFALSPGDVVIAMDRPWISGGFKIAQIHLSDLPA